MITTLNIDYNLLQKITDHAAKKRISRSKMIIQLLRKCMMDITHAKTNGSPVKYQSSRKKNSWRSFHIRLSDCDYEFFLDLRKVLKLSVSNILAHAVKKYLGDEIKDVDNYLYHAYSLIIAKINDGLELKITWEKKLNHRQKQP